MPFLPPNQQCQSTEGILFCYSYVKYYAVLVILSLVIGNNLCINILKYFHRILTMLTPYLVKLDIFEMTFHAKAKLF